MKKSKVTARDLVLVMFLLTLIVGVSYYLGFYTPLQKELANIANNSVDVDMQITTAQAKVNRMNTMQEELDEIFARPAEEITEIAAYDNKEVVLNQLNTILAQTQQYSLGFTALQMEADGTVRRNISMSFSCESYEAAKQVIRDLTDSRWRCLVSNLSISGSGGNLMEGPVSVSATITFFEHTGIQ